MRLTDPLRALSIELTVTKGWPGATGMGGEDEDALVSVTVGVGSFPAIRVGGSGPTASVDYAIDPIAAVAGLLAAAGIAGQFAEDTITAVREALSPPDAPFPWSESPWAADLLWFRLSPGLAVAVPSMDARDPGAISRYRDGIVVVFDQGREEDRGMAAAVRRSIPGLLSRERSEGPWLVRGTGSAL